MNKKTIRKTVATGFRTAFFQVTEGGFAGYAVDPDDPARRYVIDLLLDGLPLKVARADAFVAELARDGVGDACYGFAFTLPPTALADGAMAEARVANQGTPVGSPIALGGGARDSADPRPSGAVRWLGGLRFSGWCRATAATRVIVTAVIDGERVVRAEASSWVNVGAQESVSAMRAFDLHLPERLADGRVRRAHFVMENGQEIPPSPLTFVAFADGLQRSLARLGELESERLRSELFDRLVPMSLPFSAYSEWRGRYPSVVPPTDTYPFALVLIGNGDQKTSVASLRRQNYGEWVLAALPQSQGPMSFEIQLLREFLAGDALACPVVLLMLAGTTLAPDALRRLAGALSARPDAVAAYGDIEISGDPSASPRGAKSLLKGVQRAALESWPLAFSAFDYERVLEQGYCAHLIALRRPQVEEALDAGASDLYRVLNSTLDRTRDVAILHLPGVIGALAPIDTAAASRVLARATSAHLKARGVSAKVSSQGPSVLPAVRVMRDGARATTTIIIPVRNKPKLLRACLASIEPAARLERAEIIVVDNDSSDPEMLQLLKDLEQRVLILPVPGPFNFAKINNIAVQKAHTDYICLLNNDVEAVEDKWLGELTGRLAEPDVGAVGAMLLWPSGVVQHGGVVLGASFAATHAFNDRIDKDPGYGDLLRVAHECSAVTAACLLTRRSDYIAVGGMDEVHFPVNFNDVDYCLKLREAGKRIVFTPHARLLHSESASRGRDTTPDRAARFERELANLRNRWGQYLLNDPYYNPMLSLDPIPFSGLAWPPRDMSPRLNERPAATSIPPGF